jgi:hypothetical protein
MVNGIEGQQMRLELPVCEPHFPCFQVKRFKVKTRGYVSMGKSLRQFHDERRPAYARRLSLSRLV